MSNYVFYNPNPLQKFHKDGTPVKWRYNDCSVRAFAIVSGISWKQSYDVLINAGMENYMMPDDMELLKIVYNKWGYRYTTFRSNERMKLKDFVKTHKKGKFVAAMVGHVVGVVAGKYYDAWDCGDHYVTSYWEKY